jgi:MtN3 and saliva related transmembrane protein
LRVLCPRPAAWGTAPIGLRSTGMDITTAVGLLAAFCTTVSYIPQLKKCWQTRSANDLSFKTFSILAAGVALWVVYGMLRADLVIILANTVSLVLLLGILYFKVQEWRSSPATRPQSQGAKARGNTLTST